MDYRSNLRTYKKIFAYNVFLVLTNDLKSRFSFAIKWYGLALCLGLNFSRKTKNNSLCAGWLWIIAATLVYCQKVKHATHTLYFWVTYGSTSVVRKNVATENQSLYWMLKFFFAEKKHRLGQDGHGLQVQPSSLTKNLRIPRVPCTNE